jgi:hypothetical protein
MQTSGNQNDVTVNAFCFLAKGERTMLAMSFMTLLV